MKALHVVGGIVAVAVVAVVIVVPCVLLLPSDDPGVIPADLPPIEFDDLYTSKYSYKSVYPNWDLSTPAHTDFLTLDNGAVKRRDIADYTTDVKEIAPDTLYKQYSCNGYSVSADALFVFYRYNYTKVWRHSYTADFAIWDVANKREVIITHFPKDGKIHHMEWSPTGHRLAYVHDFVVKMIDDVGSGNPAIIDVSPTDGAKNMQYYGIPDWMYEEEMISSNNVLYWSPDSSRIAYLATNEEGVQLIKYTWYGDGQYPETIEIAYPKAGTTIGTAKMWVYDIDSGNNTEMASPFTEYINEFYFSRFTWNNNATALVTWTNRLQTESKAQLCRKSTTTFEFICKNNIANKEEVNGGWVGSFGPFYPLWKTNTNDYFTIYARENTTDNGYWQLVLVEESVPDTFIWLTNIKYDIVGVNYYDEVNQYVYFTAAYTEARRRHILRVKATEKDQANPECMTCNLMTSFPDRCGWISPVFGDDGSTIVINCRGPLIPLTLSMDIDKDGNWINLKVMENNDELTNTIAGTKWPVREYNKFDSPKCSYNKYNYEIFRPADFDPTKKYPLLIEVYAGPEFQKVVERFTRGFAQAYMVSQRDIIVASVDGRGSAFEGYRFMREAYLKLGHNEKVDQTDFANYLIETYDYIDAEHVAIWGWSYGGYTTSHVLGYDAGNTFQCGVAVAPLADWEWYDAMYAERYMQKPDDNRDNYIKSSIVTGNDLANFKNAWYVLIHGTADDNVHFQSAARMEKALVDADVDFDNFFYADEAHSINTGKNANKHIYHQLDLRLSHCLGRVDSPYPG